MRRGFLVRPATLVVALLANAASAAAIRVTDWPLPAPATASQPQLVAADMALHLSWIEPDGAGHRLRHARDDGRGFSPPRTIARGEDWFVNWADVPSLAVMPDRGLAAFFLRKSAAAPYAYDVLLTRSGDGRRWSAPLTAHDDGTTTEHGFASIWPWSANEVALAWLDGRHTAGGDHADHGSGGGAMTLRAAVFGADGKRREWPLDARVCDCCQTDVASTTNGPVLVYRDRSDEEIRDIAIVRWRDGEWSRPQLVHADRWHMPACPVNGPAIAARGTAVHVAWYTVVDGIARVRLARSRDDGARFAAPIDVARGAEVIGRVDVAVDDIGVYVLWSSEDAQAQTLWLARYRPDLSREDARVRVATLARGRGTGFPRLALRRDAAYVVWTDVVAKQPQLRGATIRFPR
jgi:hypothetical protein